MCCGVKNHFSSVHVGHNFGDNKSDDRTRAFGARGARCNEATAAQRACRPGSTAGRRARHHRGPRAARRAPSASTTSASRRRLPLLATFLQARIDMRATLRTRLRRERMVRERTRDDAGDYRRCIQRAPPPRRELTTSRDDRTRACRQRRTMQ